MGNKYCVKVWGKHFGDAEGYCWLQTWGGESLIRALIELVKAKRQGFGCTTLEMR